MPKVIHRDIQISAQWDLPQYIRETNSRLRDHAQVITNNRFSDFATVSFTTSTNATQVVWISNEAFDIESLNIVSTTAAGTVTIAIDGVNVGDGVTLAFDTTVVNHPLTAPNTTEALSAVTLVTAGLTGQACVTLNLRRLN